MLQATKHADVVEPLLQLAPLPDSVPPDVVAVIPAFNEERFIASVVISTLQYVRRVIVVDDGSSDRTPFLALQAGAQVIQQPHNMGKAQAINAGFRAALAHAPAAVVCLDGDAQHDPADLPKVVRPILEEGADVVIGSRFLGIENTAPGWRQVGQHALTRVTNVTSGVHLTDSQSGFRAFSPAALRLLRFDTPGLSVESEMQFLLANSGLTVREVPISVRYLDGNKRNPVVHGLQVLDAILSLVARRRPLLFFSLPGSLVAMIGLLVGLNVWSTMERTGNLLEGRALLTSLLVIGGLLLALTGVLLHSMQHMASHIAGQVRNDLKTQMERE
ncbi:glycosyltransferase family 2 protein [Deinococcus apachensis]|uniref:glycosyltransferase family 2 protein n=1 Tax=Deinococcus apachensis TaxID=309886 RepID=UPI00037A6C6E|nr:glycosyltransferase family 2 protein [Deinococcus apachensis]